MLDTLTLLLCGALLLPAPAGDDLATAREKLTAGQPGEAVDLLQGMLDRKEGKEHDVRVLLAQAQTQAGTPDRAVQTLDPLLKGDDFEALLAAGHAFRAWGDNMSEAGKKPADIDFAYQSARDNLEHAAKAAPADKLAATQLELGYFELNTAGDPAAAIKRADEMLKANPKDGDALLLRGCAGLQQAVAADGANDPSAAGIARTKAIENLLAADAALPKTRADAWMQLAWLYEADGQQRKAVDAAITILDRSPKADFTTLYHLASRYSAEHKFEAAAAALSEMVKRDAAQFTALLKADPKLADTALHFTWAVAPGANGAGAGDARKLLAAVVAADPPSADVWNNYGLACREANQNEDAYQAYTKALSYDANNPRLLNDTAVILHYYLHRDYDKAQDLYEKAVDAADAALKQPNLEAAAKTDIEDARKDAVNNLKKLAAGDHDWKG